MKLEPFAKVKKNKSAFPPLILGGAGLLGLVLAIFFWLVGDVGKPQVVIPVESSHIGLSKQISLVADDAKSGLRSVQVVLVQSNKRVVLLEKSYPPKWRFSGGGPKKVEETV